MPNELAERWAWMREATPVTRRYAYLNAGWSGPLSIDVVEAMRQRIELELVHGPTTRIVNEDRADLVTRLREATARMLGFSGSETEQIGRAHV